MPSKSFKVDYPPAKAHAISGDTLNKMGRALNSGHALGAQRNSTSYDGLLKGFSPDAPLIVGVCEISGADGDCPQDQSEPSGYGFPCGPLNKYLGKFRYYDTEDGIWREIDETEYELDAAVYYEPRNTEASPASSGQGYGAIPSYSVGDVVPCYLDRQRAKLIPIASPHEDKSIAEFYNQNPGTINAVNNVAAVLDFYVEIYRPNVDRGWRVVGAISIPLVFPDNIQVHTWVSGTCFTTVPCPQGTLIRIRGIRGNDASDQQDLLVRAVSQRLRFSSLGRRHPQSAAAAINEQQFAGGQISAGWNVNASTIARHKDAARFNIVSNTEFQVDYLDPSDEWIVGIEYYVLARIEIDEFSSTSSPSSQSTSSSVSSMSSSSHSSSSHSSSTSSASSSSHSSSTSSKSDSTSSNSSSSDSRSSLSSVSSSSRSSLSSSSAFDCIQLVQSVCFDEDACELTVECVELCFPRNTITVSSTSCPPC